MKQCNNFEFPPNLQLPAICYKLQPGVPFCSASPLSSLTETAPLDIMLEQEEPYLPVLNSLMNLL